MKLLTASASASGRGWLHIQTLLASSAAQLGLDMGKLAWGWDCEPCLKRFRDFMEICQMAEGAHHLTLHSLNLHNIDGMKANEWGALSFFDRNLDPEWRLVTSISRKINKPG